LNEKLLEPRLGEAAKESTWRLMFEDSAHADAALLQRFSLRVMGMGTEQVLVNFSRGIPVEVWS